MSVPAPRLATYEDWLALPDVRAEVIGVVDARRRRLVRDARRPPTRHCGMAPRARSGLSNRATVKTLPDGVCEALSPGTAARDLGDKHAIYQHANVPGYWIVDPSNRSLQVCRLTTEGYLLDTSVGDRGLARLRPFDALELELEALFPPVA